MTVIKALLFIAMLIPVLLTIFHAAIVEIENHNLGKYAESFDIICFAIVLISGLFSLFSDFVLGGFIALVVTKNVAKFFLRMRIG